MKLTSIVGAVPGYDYSINNAKDIIYNTMLEIGEHITEINLLEFDIPFCDGTSPNITVSSILNSIANSDGVVFICSSNLFAPSAIMQTFLEYLGMPIYKNILKDKNCMIVVVSNNSSRETLNYISNIVTYLGGYDSIKVPILESMIKKTTDTNRDVIEKYTEDFYRFVKQERKFFGATEFKTKKAVKYVSDTIPRIGEPHVEESTVNKTLVNEPPKEKVIQKPQFERLSSEEAREKDIDEISKLIANKTLYNAYAQASSPQEKTTSHGNINPYVKYQAQQRTSMTNTAKSSTVQVEPKIEPTLKTMAPVLEPEVISSTPKLKNLFNNELTSNSNIEPRSATLRQQTQNMTHYFQPNLANDVNNIFQLYIDGDENFIGYFEVYNGQCEFYDGDNKNPSVTITTNDHMWKKILDGSLSTQKAFMTGRIKVKGQFNLLSKFDIMFKKI
ncbi:MAG: SCP2 sterol-binding domain-containing protein [Lachnospirales bacterium]